MSAEPGETGRVTDDDGLLAAARRWLVNPEHFAAAAAGVGELAPLLALQADRPHEGDGPRKQRES